jgi:multicomponent Na+:H+ antiporter subunit E
MRMRTLVAVVWATIVWMALWGTVSSANLLAGVAVGLVTVALIPVAPAHASTDGGAPLRIRPVASLGFLVFFLRSLVVASAIVAWEVVTPGTRIHQGILRLPLRTQSRGLATLIANAISLTPGTLTVEVSDAPLTLYVHVLHVRTVDRTRAELRELEERALQAFQPDVLAAAPAVADQESPS